MRKTVDYRQHIGATFTRLTILDYYKGSPPRFQVRCSCGAVKDCPAALVLSGRIKSCGCWSRDFAAAQKAHAESFK